MAKIKITENQQTGDIVINVNLLDDDMQIVRDTEEAKVVKLKRRPKKKLK